MAISKAAEKRPIRTSITGDRPIFAIRNLDKENYHYRVVNDSEGRIEDLRDLGYEVVQGDAKIGEDMGADSKKGSVISRHVGRGVTGVLMRVPKEHYKDMDSEKQKVVDDRESFITGKQEGLEGSVKIARSK